MAAADEHTSTARLSRVSRRFSTRGETCISALLGVARRFSLRGEAACSAVARGARVRRACPRISRRRACTEGVGAHLALEEQELEGLAGVRDLAEHLLVYPQTQTSCIIQVGLHLAATRGDGHLVNRGGSFKLDCILPSVCTDTRPSLEATLQSRVGL